jgi:hypothetical protein
MTFAFFLNARIKTGHPWPDSSTKITRRPVLPVALSGR